jgi:hypothetical protein
MERAKHSQRVAEMAEGRGAKKRQNGSFLCESLRFPRLFSASAFLLNTPERN